MAIDDAIDEMKVPEKIDLEEEPEEIVEELTKQEKLPIIVKDLCEKISELVDYDTKELSEYNDDISGISVIVNSVKENIDNHINPKIPKQSIKDKINNYYLTHPMTALTCVCILVMVPGIYGALKLSTATEKRTLRVDKRPCYIQYHDQKAGIIPVYNGYNQHKDTKIHVMDSLDIVSEIMYDKNASGMIGDHDKDFVHVSDKGSLMQKINLDTIEDADDIAKTEMNKKLAQSNLFYQNILKQVDKLGYRLNKEGYYLEQNGN